MLGLSGDAGSDRAVGGVHRDLAGSIDETVGDEALRIGADGCGSLGSGNHGLHGSLLACQAVIEVLGTLAAAGMRAGFNLCCPRNAAHRHVRGVCIRHAVRQALSSVQ